MSSVPDIPLKMKQDPTQLLYKMAIVCKCDLIKKLSFILAGKIQGGFGA